VHQRLAKVMERVAGAPPGAAGKKTSRRDLEGLGPSTSNSFRKPDLVLMLHEPPSPSEIENSPLKESRQSTAIPIGALLVL